MSTDPGPDGEESAAGRAPDTEASTEAPSAPADAGEPGFGFVSVGAVISSTCGIADATELMAGLGAAVTATGVVAKAKIEARAEVRKAEIEAETRRLEITEETRREQMRLEAGQPAADPGSDPAEDD